MGGLDERVEAFCGGPPGTIRIGLDDERWISVDLADGATTVTGRFEVIR